MFAKHSMHSAHLHMQCVVLAGWHLTKWFRLPWLNSSADGDSLGNKYTNITHGHSLLTEQEHVLL